MMKIDTFKCKFFKLSKNKGLEFQISHWKDSSLFNLEFTYRGKEQDHKGFDVIITLFRYELRLAFYDVRHTEHYKVK